MLYGILGSGQLAWMLEQSAQKQVEAVRLVDPRLAAKEQSDAISGCDFMTFESEFLDYPAWRQSLSAKVTYPPLPAMEMLSDKWQQKLLFKKFGLPTAHAELLEAGAELPRRGVAKWSRQGYDGYGNLFLRDAKSEAGKLFSEKARLQGAQIYVEDEVDFESECALVVARDCEGKFLRYPLFQTEQKSSVCHWVWGPAPEEWEQTLQALWSKIKALLDSLDYVGTVAFEFFWQKGKLLLNEVAPRVHNSGHISLDAFNYSQFDLHLLAIRGFGDIQLKASSSRYAMKNLLGTEDLSLSEDAFIRENSPKMKTYWYGKKVSRAGRKMGHINFCFDVGSREEIKKLLEEREEEVWQKLAKK